MRSSFHICFLALAISPALAIPPESFGFPSAPNDTQLIVSYAHDGTNTPLSEADLFGVGIPANVPTVGADPSYSALASYNGSYLLIMVDADVPTPQNPSKRFLLHWMQPNMRTGGPSTTNFRIMGQLSNSTAPVVPYARPRPPPSSDPHRYILYAYKQPRNFTVPPAFSGFSAMNRTSFDLMRFMSAAGLQQPAAANYYFVSNRTGVPSDFMAPAGQSFPGGNGAAVTDGPGPSASSTGGASMTGSGGAMMTQSTGAASVVNVGEGSSAVMAAFGMVLAALL